MYYGAKILALLASLLLMTACGMREYVKPVDVSGYPYRYADFDYKYAWKTARMDNGVVIDGIMKNVRYPFVSSVQLTVYARGKDGNIIAKATTFPMPQQTEAIEGDVNHFSLLLKNITPVPGDVYQFLVHYTADEGGHNDGVDWISSFKVDALTGAPIRSQNRSVDEW